MRPWSEDFSERMDLAALIVRWYQVGATVSFLRRIGGSTAVRYVGPVVNDFHYTRGSRDLAGRPNWIAIWTSR
jgi:hypothetical protein